MTDQQCPQCGRISPASATRCDCGYSFTTGAGLSSMVEPPARMYGQYAVLSLVLPLAAWITQTAFVLLQGPVPEAPGLAILVVLMQFALIIAGLYYSLKAVTAGRPFLSPGRRAAAIAGLVLSCGTIMLIVVVAAMS